ncbi:MAG: isoleucine--tRNA ligase, partial [Campylobacter hyointestinalis]
LIAPTLTYSVDEAIEFAPQIIKKDFGDVFDIVYDDLDYEFDIDDNLLLASREKFNEIVDTLKKEKIIKSTLEVMLETSSNEILANDLDEVIDWYMVSFVKSIEDGETLATFEVGNEQFKVVKASRYKCPRCWKYDAKEENCLCPRCSKVLKNV